MKRILLIIGIMAFSANLPAPLFPIYQVHFNLNNFDITTLFAIYTACMLPILLIAGPLVKRRGTKWVVTFGVISALISATIFTATNTPCMLYLARAIEGIALGAFMGTSNALLLQHTSDIYRSLALSSMATLLGFGLGPAISGLIAQYSLSIPERLPYLVLIIALILAIVLLFTLPHIDEKKDKYSPIRFQLGIPSTSRTLFLMFICPAVFVMLALNGVVISLIPTYVHSILNSNNLAYSGLLLFIFLGGGSLAQQISWPNEKVQRIQIGIVFLIIGTWFMVTAGTTVNMMFLLIGMIILAIGNGWTFQASIQLAGSFGKPSEKSSIISTYYVAGYTGMAFPTIGVGLLSTSIGLTPALITFGIIVTLLGICIIVSPKFLMKLSESC